VSEAGIPQDYKYKGAKFDYTDGNGAIRTQPAVVYSFGPNDKNGCSCTSEYFKDTNDEIQLTQLVSACQTGENCCPDVYDRLGVRMDVKVEP
jgi:hypothetical protein